MRIFKNRGDIYFSKTDRKKSTEQKILITSLVFIVLFTIIFVLFTGIKNDFSIKNFFRPESLNEIEQVTDNEIPLPQLTGKINYLVMIKDDSRLLFSYIIQLDKDNTAYKLTAIKGSTEIDGDSLDKILFRSGEKNALLAVESLLDTDFDYYISFEKDKFIDLFDRMGSVKYPIVEEIRYKNNATISPYSIRLKEGEQTIKGSKAVDLVRYFLDNNKESQANDFLLNCLIQQVNGKNYENKEELFQLFIKNSSTNITVRDFSKSDDTLMVMSSERSGVKVYNAPASYNGEKITKDSLKEIKGYYVK